MEKFSLGVLLIALVVGLSVLICGLLQFCWNEVSANVFGAPTLTFWQTYGLMVMTTYVGRCFQPVKSSATK